MKTDLGPKHESHYKPEQKRQPDQREVVSVDWAESEWFRIWLKLARHELDGQEVAC